MAATLIIEDGSIVEDANTYINVADVKTYASDRGVILGTDDEVNAQIISAMDYVESKECEFQGQQVEPGVQELSWPRSGVQLNGVDFPSDKIPKQLRSAISQLVIAQFNGVVLFPNTTPSDYIVEETVGPITTKYANPQQTGITDMSPQMTAVDALLAPLYGNCGQSTFSLRTVRV